MSVRIPSGSRLKYSTLQVADGVEFWDIADYPTIPTSSLDTVYTVTATDRLDTLAYQFYGDPTLGWIIAVANNLDLMPTDLSPGMTLVIPAQQTVQQQIVKLTPGKL
jgi:nucleoid-associated protein YgaU